MSAPITLAASVVVFKRELEQKQLSIEDVMRACADLGIPALEVRDEEGLGLPPADAPAAELARACERLRLLSSGIGVELIVASGASLGLEADCPRLLRAIDAAHSLGSPVVRVFLPKLATWHVGADFDHSVVQPLEPGLRAADAAGVLLCVENTSSPEGSVSRIMGFVDQVESQLGLSIGMTLDTGNCLMNEQDGDPRQAAKLAGRRVRYVHLKDVRCDMDSNLKDCAPGFGSIDFRSFFGELNAGCFQGYACFEFDGAGEGLVWLGNALSKEVYNADNHGCGA